MPRENRSDFVRRVPLSEMPKSEPDTPEAEPEEPESEPETPDEAKGAEMAAVKPGYYLLNTDGGNKRRLPGDALSQAAIGALLRTRRLVNVAQISKAIGPATHNVAEYQALIEGLMLARAHGIEHIRVYSDSELVVDQVNGASAVKQPHLQELHEQVCDLRAGFKTFRIGWVPREWNLEADQLVRDALAEVP